MMNLKTKESDPIAKEGLPIIAGSLFVSGLLYKWDKKTLASLTGLFSLFSTYFFRNPERKTPDLRNGVISAADGTVIFTGEGYERYFLKKYVKKISIFMSLFDVHVNRSPVDGFVVDIKYNRGKFFSANLDKASTENEQCAIHIKTEDKRDIVVVQIAGLVARRIVTYPKAGEQLNKGDIIGLIKFGSRVDIYIDGGFEQTVRLKEHVKAGETVLGLLR